MNMDAKNHDAERWLDDDLAQYARAEPRSGLEGRVLTRLAQAEEASSQSPRWWGALAFSTAVILALALVWLGHVDSKRVQQPVAAKVTVSPQAGEPAIAVTPSSIDGGDVHNRVVVGKQALVGGPSPKRERFPSPLPLTAQEKMLEMYVRDFPERAALIARAQTDLRKQDEIEMAAPRPTTTPTSLEPHE